MWPEAQRATSIILFLGVRQMVFNAKTYTKKYECHKYIHLCIYLHHASTLIREMWQAVDQKNAQVYHCAVSPKFKVQNALGASPLVTIPAIPCQFVQKANSWNHRVGNNPHIILYVPVGGAIIQCLFGVQKTRSSISGTPRSGWERFQSETLESLCQSASYVPKII